MGGVDCQIPPGVGGGSSEELNREVTDPTGSGTGPEPVRGEGGGEALGEGFAKDDGERREKEDRDQEDDGGDQGAADERGRR